MFIHHVVRGVLSLASLIVRQNFLHEIWMQRKTSPVTFRLSDSRHPMSVIKKCQHIYQKQKFEQRRETLCTKSYLRKHSTQANFHYFNIESIRNMFLSVSVLLNTLLNDKHESFVIKKMEKKKRRHVLRVVTKIVIKLNSKTLAWPLQHI